MLVFIVAFFMISIRLSNSNESWLLMFLTFANIHGIIISSILTPYMCPFYLVAFARYSKISGKSVKRIKVTKGQMVVK